jgi:hypothetical protein
LYGICRQSTTVTSKPIAALPEDFGGESLEKVNFPEIDRMLRMLWDARIAEASLKSMFGEIETYLHYKDFTPEPFR